MWKIWSFRRPDTKHWLHLRRDHLQLRVERNSTRLASTTANCWWSLLEVITLDSVEKRFVLDNELVFMNPLRFPWSHVLWWYWWRQTHHSTFYRLLDAHLTWLFVNIDHPNVIITLSTLPRGLTELFSLSLLVSLLVFSLFRWWPYFIFNIVGAG